MNTGASRGAVVAGDDFNANTAVSVQSLQKWYNPHGLWDTTGWWNAANCLEAIENAIVANNGQDYSEVLRKTFDHNSAKNFLNEYYDDEGWWALAWIRAYDLTGELRYLAMAKIIFADIQGGWDDHCDGGIWWKKDRRYKNAIANELFLLVAIRLHQRTPCAVGSTPYLDWAQREWRWFKHSGMINVHNLINDGLNRACENNGRTTWTYNQGVLIGGLTELYRVTGDSNTLRQAVAIADAATATLIDSNGILCEPGEPERGGGHDVPQFKGIFIRHLAQLYDVTRKPEYYDFMFRNAHSVWFNNRDGSNHFGLRWSGPVDAVDAARHSSAIMAVSALAEPMTSNLIFAKGAGSAAFNHEVGTATGTLAWSCDPAHATQSGFLLSGPYLSSLPVGTHSVHFRIAVSDLIPSTATLVRLDVRENNGGTILNSREIVGNMFSETNHPFDFALTFTNATASDPLEFRAYWNRVPAGPVVTVTDITIGAFPSWTAANLGHDLGRLDGLNAWTADPVENKNSGYLVKGSRTGELPTGEYAAAFELKVDNFNKDDSKVATLSVVAADAGSVVAARDVTRKEFPTTLYQSFPLRFKAAPNKCYEFRTFWHYAPGAARLTQRSVALQTD
jgi:predicted alpha-1,6-mannanase (GH76 family)